MVGNKGTRERPEASRTRARVRAREYDFTRACVHEEVERSPVPLFPRDEFSKSVNRLARERLRERQIGAVPSRSLAILNRGDIR